MNTVCPSTLGGGGLLELWQARTPAWSVVPQWSCYCVCVCVWVGCQLQRPTQAPVCGTPRVVKRESLLGRSIRCAQFPELPCKAEQGDYVHRARDALAIKRHAPLSQGLVLPAPPTHHPPQQRIVVYRIALEIPIPFYFLHSHSS